MYKSFIDQTLYHFEDLAVSMFPKNRLSGFLISARHQINTNTQHSSSPWNNHRWSFSTFVRGASKLVSLIRHMSKRGKSRPNLQLTPVSLSFPTQLNQLGLFLSSEYVAVKMILGYESE